MGFIDRGRNVVSSSKDGTCRLWDCGTGKCLVKFSPDGGGQVNSLAVVASSAQLTGNLDLSKDFCVLFLIFVVYKYRFFTDEHEAGTENKVLAMACESDILAAFSMRDKANV